MNKEKLENITELTCEKLYDRLENKSKEFEKKYSILTISKFVDDNTEENESLVFIDSYRKFIRGNNWYYDDNRGSAYFDLLNRWGKTHEFYMDAAETFFINLNNNNEITHEIHDLALVSETLRGREGKRSKIGLDMFLDSYVAKLTRMITEEFKKSEAEDIIGLFTSTLNLPLVSAENELFFDFFNYKNKINETLNYENFEEIEKETKGLCSKILREYCKYSFRDFNKKCSKLITSEELLTKKNNFLKSIKNEKDVLKEEIYSSLVSKNGKEADDFVRVTNRIDNLNYLNTNIEVKFSFKGWPGLFHHFIFRREEVYSNNGDIYHKRFVNMCEEKGRYNWNLK